MFQNPERSGHSKEQFYIRSSSTHRSLSINGSPWMLLDANAQWLKDAKWPQWVKWVPPSIRWVCGAYAPTAVSAQSSLMINYKGSSFDHFILCLFSINQGLPILPLRIFLPKVSLVGISLGSIGRRLYCPTELLCGTKRLYSLICAPSPDKYGIL